MHHLGCPPKVVIKKHYVHSMTQSSAAVDFRVIYPVLAVILCDHCKYIIVLIPFVSCITPSKLHLTLDLQLGVSPGNREEGNE